MYVIIGLIFLCFILCFILYYYFFIIRSKQDWIILTHESYKYGKKGEYWKSIESAEKAIELNPRASEAWRLMGNAYELLGDALRDAAIYGPFIFTRLEEIGVPSPHNEKTWAIFNQLGGLSPDNYYKKATEAWDKAKEINPKIIIPGHHE